MKHYKWPSIGQYREVVRNIERRARFAGVDERGEPIINIAADYPTLEFVGTVKLHGTNAAVVIGDGEHWFQSRERIITPEKDNAGFEFPVIMERSACIACGACERVCPVLMKKKDDENLSTSAYAAFSNNNALRLESSSGGIFLELAVTILQRGGVIYGGSYDDEGVV